MLGASGDSASQDGTAVTIGVNELDTSLIYFLSYPLSLT